MGTGEIVKLSLMGGVVFALGTLVNFLFEITLNLIFTKISFGTIIAYTTPFCWFKGFKGCGKKSFKSGIVLFFAFGLIFGAYFFGGLEAFVPLTPLVVSAVITLLANVIITHLSHGDNAISHGINRMSEHAWTMLQLGLGAFLVPGAGLVKMGVETYMNKRSNNALSI